MCKKCLLVLRYQLKRHGLGGVKSCAQVQSITVSWKHLFVYLNSPFSPLSLLSQLPKTIIYKISSYRQNKPSPSDRTMTASTTRP